MLLYMSEVLLKLSCDVEAAVSVRVRCIVEAEL
jgi:hypothetical protein